MSRSRKKIAKRGFCNGDNTEYYRLARRQLRRLNKQHFNEQKRGLTVEALDEETMSFQKKHTPMYDDWNEPTDGSCKLYNKPQEKQYRNNSEELDRKKDFWKRHRRK